MLTQKHHLVMSGVFRQSFAIDRGGFCLFCGDLNDYHLEHTDVP